MEIEVKLAPKLKEVFGKPARYRVAYGGRGSSKSWGFARMFLIEMLQNPGKPFLCARELQNSIKDSVHKLLSDQVHMMGLDDYFDVGESYFRCKNGAYAIFKGLRTNAHEIKSLEGVVRAWIEEAQKVSQQSLELLIPTIRAPGSEIWFSYNPDEAEDAVHQMFVINKPPPNSLVTKINWNDNPWFPNELEDERAFFQMNDPDNYAHVWGGECRRFMQGAIYGKQMSAMREEGRITKVPWNPSVPVNTIWDLGYADMLSIGFEQEVGKEPRFIDHYSNHLEAIDHYVTIIKSKPYLYGVHVLPHDAGHKSLRTGKTLAQQLEDLGLGKLGRDIIVLPPDNIEPGIELVRQLLPQLWMDEENCKGLIKSLFAYQYEWDEERQVFKPRPLHNWASHDADMIRYAATYLATKRSPVVKTSQHQYSNRRSWMG